MFGAHEEIEHNIDCSIASSILEACLSQKEASPPPYFLAWGAPTGTVQNEPFWTLE